MISYDKIPSELRDSGLWIRTNGKTAVETYKTDEDKAAHMKPFALALAKKRPKENLARLIDKSEGFVFVDLDHVRDEKGKVEPWALEIIQQLDTYCEVSGSGTGFHLVARGTLPEDYLKSYPDPARPGHNKGVPVELKSGNTKNRLFTLTGDVYSLDPTIQNRQEALDQLLRNCKAGKFLKPSVVDTSNWRDKFHTVEELPDGDIEFLIEQTLPKGVAFIGALSGAGKTWFCLSLARALTTGKKFLGIWDVPNPVNVLYLCPEMSAKAFKRRCVRFGIGGERFRCQTISDGMPLDLLDPMLIQAVKELQPVVFLDTAIRFANVEDENSASQNAQGMAKAVFALLHLGAQAVVCLHHRSKDNAKNKIDEMTLENALRGTGDLGAMCDVVWGLQYDRADSSLQYLKESRDVVRLAVRCVKARDFRTPEDYRIQLEPFIDSIGDMAVLTEETKKEAEHNTESERLDSAIAANPTASIRRIAEIAAVGRNRVLALAAKSGWVYDEKSKWSKSVLFDSPESEAGIA
jgi:hypothetical protein